jgi:cysteine desulfurase
VGFGVAARLAQAALSAGEPERLLALRDRLLAGLMRRIDGVAVNGALEPRLPGNLNVSIARAEAERVLLTLGERLALSSGAACAEAGGKGSHVLRALGLPEERVYTALRFGIGRYNVESEIDETVEALSRAVAEVRSRAVSLPG